ncbi:MAG: hypothetical protein EAX91_11135 [Candidatus Lokiarchaeota archaeon]|nr:hypothetical protein [Candidatus Lokiarchaeota archaeon]
MVESKSRVNFELDQSLYEVLKESLRDEVKLEPVKFPFEKEELEQVDKDRSLKRWKKSEGYYYLNPDKFKFGLKDL